MVVGVFLFVHIPSKAAVPFVVFDTRILLTEGEGNPLKIFKFMTVWNQRDWNVL